MKSKQDIIKEFKEQFPTFGETLENDIRRENEIEDFLSSALDTIRASTIEEASTQVANLSPVSGEIIRDGQWLAKGDVEHVLQTLKEKHD